MIYCIPLYIYTVVFMMCTCSVQTVEHAVSRLISRKLRVLAVRRAWSSTTHTTLRHAELCDRDSERSHGLVKTRERRAFVLNKTGL